MKISKGQEGESDAIIEQEVSRVQAIIDTVKGMLSALSMTCAELQQLVSGHVEAVKTTYAQVHSNYHNQFDDSCNEGQCGPDCLFTYAEQRFSDAMTKIIESITKDRMTLTAEEIDALARKHGYANAQ